MAYHDDDVIGVIVLGVDYFTSPGGRGCRVYIVRWIVYNVQCPVCSVHTLRPNSIDNGLVHILHTCGRARFEIYFILQ